MNINISFDTDHVTFNDNFLMEVTKVTRSIKTAILDSKNTTAIRRPLKGIKGNRIGTISISHYDNLANSESQQDRLFTHYVPIDTRSNASKHWYVDGKRHRTDGPAIEWGDGTKFWYLNGKRLTEAEWLEAIK